MRFNQSINQSAEESY